MGYDYKPILATKRSSKTKHLSPFPIRKKMKEKGQTYGCLRYGSSNSAMTGA